MFSRRRPKALQPPGSAPPPPWSADAGSAAPAGTGQPPRGGANGLRSFNRYEIKYLVDTRTARELSDELATRLDRDEHSPVGGYGVWSLYYDTDGLRFYWEKIEGLRFRRKLRLRHYGDPRTLTDDSLVYVEIKQRVNRVTQKRRVGMPYHQARALLDQRRPIEHGPGEAGFIDEVQELVVRLDLRPVAITGYQREALVGRGADLGLRVTFDRRIRGRDRDFHLATPAENRFIVPPHLSVLEVKANERVPYWLTDLTARRNLQVVRVSKYCQSIETYGRAPRSVFHLPEEIESSSPASGDVAVPGAGGAPVASGTPAFPAVPDAPDVPDDPRPSAGRPLEV